MPAAKRPTGGVLKQLRTDCVPSTPGSPNRSVVRTSNLSHLYVAVLCVAVLCVTMIAFARHPVAQAGDKGSDWAELGNKLR
jgi:hypothetical protein